jgi:hypothetical protein
MRTLRTSLLVLLAVPVLVLVLALALARGGKAATAHQTVHVDTGGLVKAIRRYRSATGRLRLVMGRRGALAPVRHVSLLRARTIWRRRAFVTLRHFLAGPVHRRAWLCIHRYEGSWTDGGAPYYGGLQMDLGFQQRYGGVLLRAKGTADHWTPLEQMWTAENAYRSGRGFYPWPNTARSCGLI